MPNLFPTETQADNTLELMGFTPTQGYQNGIGFDDSVGDFLRDGKNRLVDNTGIESWKSWCTNCLQTERYKHLAYGSDFGIELDAVFAATSTEEKESILIHEISDALMADPYKRTQYIELIEFDWQGTDSVWLHVIVHGIDDVTIDITRYITKEV